jgi:hypothetical protein
LGSEALATIACVNGEGRTKAAESSGVLASKRMRFNVVRRRKSAVVEQAKQRSDPRARRDWLRFLDPILTDEIHDAGAVSCDELVDLPARPLKGRVSRETIGEWWEYAHRRGWLEECGADRCRLTAFARERLEARRQYVRSPDPSEWAKTLIRWVLPAGALGAVGYLSGRYGTAWIAAVLVCITVALMLFVIAPIVYAIDKPSDRWIARRACDWLDGRRVAWSIRPRPAVRDFTRLYQE